VVHIDQDERQAAAEIEAIIAFALIHVN
jgi:hypothetical protein